MESTLKEYMQMVNAVLSQQEKSISNLQSQMASLIQHTNMLLSQPEIRSYWVKHINKAQIDYQIACYKSAHAPDCKNGLTVSLTSYPARMYEIKYTLFSIARQTLKPDRIILWLSYEEFPHREDDIARSLLELVEKFGVQIQWCENLRSYNKLIPTLKAYPNDIIVTADDDMFYEESWLESLYLEYLKCKSIIAHRAHQVILKNDSVEAYNNWRGAQSGSTSVLNFATGVGGVLYYPGCFHKDILDSEKFLRLCPKADDIWFWAMAVLNGQKIHIPQNPLSELVYVNPVRECSFDGIESRLSEYNLFQSGNDGQLADVLEQYPELLKILKQEGDNSLFKE